MPSFPALYAVLSDPPGSAACLLLCGIFVAAVYRQGWADGARWKGQGG